MTREEIKKAKELYLKALDLYLLEKASCIAEGIEMLCKHREQPSVLGKPTVIKVTDD